MFLVNVIEYFFVGLSLGISCFIFLHNTSITGVGFSKLLSIISILALFLSTVANHISNNSNEMNLIIYFLSFCIHTCIYIFHNEKRNTPIIFLYYLVFLLLSYVILHECNFEFIKSIYFFSFSFILGITLYSMLLGHWYLIVPKMSENPLKNALKIFWIIFATKLVLSLYSLISNISFLNDREYLQNEYLFNWIMISMRFLWGYLVMGVISLFNWQLVKIRSLQSATGMFYAMSFFCLAGEIISLYIFYKMRLYI